MIVHQVFGLLGDEMPQLFVDCKERIKKWCKKNNYEYKFWNKSDCDNLIKTKYPKYQNLYDNVKYPIMKVDIIRWIILHNDGGIYMDLDVDPLINDLIDSDLVLGKKVLNGTKGFFYEPEIIQMKKNNPISLEVLDYIITQIEIKNKIDIYEDWKCRYVLQTTGPKSISRFFKKKKIDTYLLTYGSTYIKKNEKLDKLHSNYDFISHPSCSWIPSMKNLTEIH